MENQQEADVVEVEVSREVSAPPARVWDLATDVAGSPRYLSGVETVEVLTPGPFVVGTRWRETRRLHGRSATEEMTATALTPQQSYTAELSKATAPLARRSVMQVLRGDLCHLARAAQRV